MSDTFTPFVYWAQTESQITLKVDLTDVKDLNVDTKENLLEVTAYGQGARGWNNYSFSLNLHSPIDSDVHYKVIDRQVDFILKKKSNGWWPRLTSYPQKPSWLKIDFDKWKSEDMDDNEDEKRDIRNDYPDIFEKLLKEEYGYTKEEYAKGYLVIYDLFQFVGFIYVLAVMGIRYSRDGPGFMNYTFVAVGIPLKFIQVLQFLEVMHPLFGYTKNSFFISFIQVGARAFVLFCLIDVEPRIQTKPVVFYLFLVWSMIEIIRYPYYIIQLLNVKVHFLTWLRYTLWIPLYPLGFLCESFIVLLSIPYFEETKKFTVSLPNTYNFAFHFPSLLRICLLLFFLPGFYTAMSHMKRLRSKKLGKSNIKRKCA